MRKGQKAFPSFTVHRFDGVSRRSSEGEPIIPDLLGSSTIGAPGFGVYGGLNEPRVSEPRTALRARIQEFEPAKNSSPRHYLQAVRDSRQNARRRRLARLLSCSVILARAASSRANKATIATSKPNDTMKIAKGAIAVAKLDFSPSLCSAAIVAIKRQLRIE